MSDYTHFLGLIAACMARGCTPEETDEVMDMLYAIRPDQKASEIQTQIQAAITLVQSQWPDLPDLVFPPIERKGS